MPESTGTRAVTSAPSTQIWVERFVSAWQKKPLSESQLLLLFLGGLTLICGSMAFIGAVPTRIYGHDIFIYLGNGWRILRGQRPHVDFTTPWGPIGFLISALGLRICRYSAVGIGFGSAILGSVVGVWSFFLSKNLLTRPARLTLSFFLSALAVAPYPLGLAFINSSSAMIYNRYGYALLGLVLIESFLVTRHTAKHQTQDWVLGLSSGAALSLMLFLKASYFFTAVALMVCLGWFFRRFVIQRILGILVGFSLVSLCVLAYLRFHVSAMLMDLRMASGARAETMKFPLFIILDHWPVLLGIVFFCLAAALLVADTDKPWGGVKLATLGAIVFFADVAVIRSNAQNDGFIICAIFAILMIDAITQEQKRLPWAQFRAKMPAFAGVVFLGALFFIPQFASDLMGLGFAAWEKERAAAPGVLRFTAPNLKPLILYESDDNPPSEGRMFTNYVNDGVALLTRASHPDETVLTMDVTNPFPYAMGRRPARGGHAAPTYHYNITDRFRPSPEWFFGDADIVMVPKRPSQGDNHYLDFYQAYGPWLKDHFDLAAETTVWWMYRRK